jgi:membrane protein
MAETAPGEPEVDRPSAWSEPALLGFLLPGNPEREQQLINSALSQFPIIGDQLTSSAQPLRGSGSGLAIGILVAPCGGLGVAVAIHNALNQVWGLP